MMMHGPAKLRQYILLFHLVG